MLGYVHHEQTSLCDKLNHHFHSLPLLGNVQLPFSRRCDALFSSRTVKLMPGHARVPVPQGGCTTDGTAERSF